MSEPTLPDDTGEQKRTSTFDSTTLWVMIGMFVIAIVLGVVLT